MNGPSKMSRETKRGKFMLNETIPVAVPAKVYLDLSFQVRKNGDLRSLEEIVVLAIRNWMAARSGGAAAKGGRGYQWGELFLPEGTELKMRYRGTWYYANVMRDRLMYGGDPVSPRQWGLMVTGGVRNAWRDVWLRRSATDVWSRASMWRAASAKKPLMPGTERRQRVRRCTD
jgi:hypothetical protein